MSTPLHALFCTTGRIQRECTLGMHRLALNVRGGRIAWDDLLLILLHLHARPHIDNRTVSKSSHANNLLPEKWYCALITFFTTSSSPVLVPSTCWGFLCFFFFSFSPSSSTTAPFPSECEDPL